VSERAPRPSRLRSILRWSFAALGVAGFANTLRHAELDRAGHLITSIGPVVVIVLAPWGIALALQAVGFARILRAIGRRVAFGGVFSAMLSAEAVLMSMPAGQAVAESINPYLLKRRCGVPIAEGLVATGTKKSLIVFANSIYMGIAVAFGSSWLQQASPALTGGRWLVALVIGAALGLLAAAIAMGRAISSGSLASRAHGLLRRIPVARLQRWLDEQRQGFTDTDGHATALSDTGGPALAAAAAAFLACWLVEGTEAWVILSLLGVHIPLAEVLAFEVVVSLLRSIAFMVPAGLGVQDASYVAFFGAFGIPDAATLGVAFVLVKRAKELFWIAAGFALFVVRGDLPGAAEAPERA
jgi:uncharacterized protein (TIRG00374 family)